MRGRAPPAGLGGPSIPEGASPSGHAVKDPNAPARGAPRVLVDGPLDPGAIEAALAGADCGAVLVFVGRVRGHHEGRPVPRLTYSAYPALAETRIRRICSDLEEAADGPLRVRIVHRLGPVDAGEASVVIAVASAHRAEAYEASRIALERLKREVPVWKKEHFADGDATWREVEPLV